MTLVALNDVRVSARRRRLDQAKVRELADSIAQVGLLNPITIGADGALIAGLHRLEATRYLGCRHIEATILPLAGDLAELAEIDENLIRNDLTVLERGEHLVDRKGIYERLHPETRQGANGRRGSGEGAYISKNEMISFSDDTAAKTGVTPRTIEQEVQIGTAIAPDVRDALRATPVADSKTDLLALARMAPDHQRRIAEQIVNGAADKVSEAHRLVTAASAGQAAALPTARYRVVYADPPWSYGNTQPDYHHEQRDHYPVMPLAAICALPVRDWVEDDAVLFLWVTAPILEESFQVVHAWGFQYKTCFVWDKVRHNMGHYSSVRHELLLLATRGACQPDVRRLFDSVVTVERTAHSAKPEEFRHIIDTLYPNGRRIELFARRRAEGWEAYGNQL